MLEFQFRIKRPPGMGWAMARRHSLRERGEKVTATVWTEEVWLGMSRLIRFNVHSCQSTSTCT